MRKQDANGTWYGGIPSWDELGKMAQAGTINQVLSEGDLIPIRLSNGEENAIRVTHDQADNMFFVFKNCLDKSASINDAPTNLGGWCQSKMQKHLNEEVFPLLPAELQAAIQQVQIEQEMINGTFCGSLSRLFLPSEEQVFGICGYSKPETGASQLECFKGSNTSRVKMRNGKPTWWWLRSPYFGSGGNFVNVSSSGAVDYDFANYSCSVAPAFCLIEPKKI